MPFTRNIAQVIAAASSDDNDRYVFLQLGNSPAVYARFACPYDQAEDIPLLPQLHGDLYHKARQWNDTDAPLDVSTVPHLKLLKKDRFVLVHVDDGMSGPKLYDAQRIPAELKIGIE